MTPGQKVKTLLNKQEKYTFFSEQIYDFILPTARRER
jgi:hypothetical protein